MPPGARFSWFPTGIREIEATDFASLFPAAALANGRHGFPFTGVDLPGNVVGINDAGWLGSIPATGQPSFAWLFKRDCRFGYREHLGEDNALSACRGQLDVGAQLRLALETTHFLQHLARRLKLDGAINLTIQLDAEGVRGRSLVNCVDAYDAAERRNAWSTDRATATMSTTVSDVVKSPVDVGARLVAEFALKIEPAFVPIPELRRVLLERRKGARLVFVDNEAIKALK